MLSKKKSIIIITIILVMLSIAIITVTHLYSTRFVTPQSNDFALYIKYDKATDTVTMELENVSDNNYELWLDGAQENFTYLHIILGESELPISKDLLLGKVTLKRHSSIKQEISLDTYEDLHGDCEMYASVHFYITDSKTSEKYEFDLKSDTILRE